MSYDELQAAVNRFFSDTTRPRAETIDGLEELAAEIDTMIDALKEDERRVG